MSSGILKKIIQQPQTVAREARDMRERRDQKFGVRSSENLEPRTSNPRPFHPSRKSRSAILRGRVLSSQTCGALDSKRASIVLPHPASLKVVHV